jgi:hypothetical protein
VKNPFRNVRVVLLTAVLLIGAAILLLREQLRCQQNHPHVSKWILHKMTTSGHG